MPTENEYKGRCFCGAVELRIVGKPSAMGYCHCTSGADQLGSFKKTENSIRKWCKACGGHVLTEHPAWGLNDVYAATIPDFPFEPMLHVNYGETVLRVRDGLPKMKDLPKEMGGSGISAPE